MNVSTSSISCSLTTNAGSDSSMPTNGTTRIPLTVVWTGGSAPISSVAAASNPISSNASRSAV